MCVLPFCGKVYTEVEKHCFQDEYWGKVSPAYSLLVIEEFSAVEGTGVQRLFIDII
jgi:hypothetical protein